MKQNGTRLTAKCGYGHGGIGMKKLIALILALALALAMLGAVSEESDESLALGESVQVSDEAIIIDYEVADEGGMDIELAEEAILDEDALVVDGLSLDGLEDNLLPDGLAELDGVAEGPVNVLTDNEIDPEDFEIDENGVLVKYKGEGGDVVIPDEITAIGEEAFYECESLTSVTIPDGVTSIGAFAFWSCESLTNVKIPDSVTSIGDSAFKWCSSLTSVTIGAGVSIDDLLDSELLGNSATEAFEVSEDNDVYASKDGLLYTHDMATLLRCPKAKTSVAIPNSVTSIGDEAFENSNNLTNVTIPNSVTSIGDDAFNHCESLTNITIPNSVTSIGMSAFDNCRNLTRVTIGAGINFDDILYCGLLDASDEYAVTDNNDVYASEDGILYTYDMSTLLRCPNKKTSVTIPDSVTIIYEDAFWFCRDLTSVTIPDSVTSIGLGAFCHCSSLTNVTIPDGVTIINFMTFDSCESLKHVTIPEGVTTICKSAFEHCSGLKDVYIPTTVKTIEAYAFHGAVDLDHDGEVDWDYEEDEEVLGPLDLTIHGYVGSYAETYAREEGFKFSPIGGPVSLSKAKVTVPAQVYSGKAKKPAVKVVLNGQTLKKGTDYTVSYKNNKAIGTATAIVKGKGNYTGTVKKTFKINPKAVKDFKVISIQRGILANWKKASGVTGYQLQYGLKKNFSGAKKVTITKARTVTRVIKNLKKGKTFYARIRAYKKVGKKIYYSAWSARKKVKIS